MLVDEGPPVRWRWALVAMVVLATVWLRRTAAPAVARFDRGEPESSVDMPDDEREDGAPPGCAAFERGLAVVDAEASGTLPEIADCATLAHAFSAVVLFETARVFGCVDVVSGPGGVADQVEIWLTTNVDAPTAFCGGAPR